MYILTIVLLAQFGGNNPSMTSIVQEHGNKAQCMAASNAIQTNIDARSAGLVKVVSATCNQK